MTLPNLLQGKTKEVAQPSDLQLRRLGKNWRLMKAGNWSRRLLDVASGPQWIHVNIDLEEHWRSLRLCMEEHEAQLWLCQSRPIQGLHTPCLLVLHNGALLSLAKAL